MNCPTRSFRVKWLNHVILTGVLGALVFKFRSIVNITEYYRYGDDSESTPGFHVPVEHESNTSPLKEPTAAPTIGIAADLNEVDMNKFDTKKPYLIFHVGPPKTGTTSIQCGLEINSAKLALEDNYYFIGKRCYPPMNKELKMPNNETKGIFNAHLMVHQLNRANHINVKNTNFEYFKKRLDYHFNNDHNVIFSCEAFSNPETWSHKLNAWKLLMPLFARWNVVIVIAYRRYYEWLPSRNYHMDYNGLLKHPKWPHMRTDAEKSHLQAAKKDKRRFMIGLMEHDLNVIGNNTDGISWQRNVHMAANALHKYTILFTNVTLFNFHLEGDLVTNFVCHALPTADKTCAILKSQNVSSSYNNQAKSLDGKKLVMAAYDKGLIRKGEAAPRKMNLLHYIDSKMREFYNSTDDIPRICASVWLQKKVLNVSLALEEYLSQKMPHISLQAEVEHREGFALAVKNKKFCDIDVKTMLRDPRWKRFFSRYS